MYCLPSTITAHKPNNVFFITVTLAGLKRKVNLNFDLSFVSIIIKTKKQRGASKLVQFINNFFGR
jgi:hypothetical protein